MSNASVLKASIRRFDTLKRKQIMPLMEKMARTLLEDALTMRYGWAGFTGNLPTSYAAAIWDFDGKPYGDIIYAEDIDGYYSISTIIRRKIDMWQSVHLDDPWEGHPRTVTGAAPIKFQWGPQMSEWFLTGYKPKQYPCICICTGAEYSKIVEERYGNVLEESAEEWYVKRIGDMIFASKEFTA